MERQKIELRNASVAIGSTGPFSRNGAPTSGNLGAKAAVAVPALLSTSSSSDAAGQRKGG